MVPQGGPNCCECQPGVDATGAEPVAGVTLGSVGELQAARPMRALRDSMRVMDIVASLAAGLPSTALAPRLGTRRQAADKSRSPRVNRRDVGPPSGLRYVGASMSRSQDPPPDPSFPRGAGLLHDPRLNKGTAFTPAERDALGLRGLLPPRMFTQEEQERRILANLRRTESPL